MTLSVVVGADEEHIRLAERNAEQRMKVRLVAWLDRKRMLGHVTQEQAAFADELLLECFGVG